MAWRTLNFSARAPPPLLKFYHFTCPVTSQTWPCFFSKKWRYCTLAYQNNTAMFIWSSCTPITILVKTQYVLTFRGCPWGHTCPRRSRSCRPWSSCPRPLASSPASCRTAACRRSSHETIGWWKITDLLHVRASLPWWVDWWCARARSLCSALKGVHRRYPSFLHCTVVQNTGCQQLIFHFYYQNIFGGDLATLNSDGCSLAIYFR